MDRTSSWCSNSGLAEEAFPEGDGEPEACETPPSGRRGSDDAECDLAASWWTIRDMAEEFGITPRAIRFYEERGLLRPRRAGTARCYGPRERLHLKMILKGKELGFTLSEIRDILGAREADAFEWDLGPEGLTASDFEIFGMRLEGAAGPDIDRIDLSTIEMGKLDLAMALRPEQLAAQIDHLERQRRQLDEAIIALREAHRLRSGRSPRHASR